MDSESIEKLEKIAFHYKQSTGVNCMFVQNLDDVTWPLDCGSQACKECHAKAMQHSVSYGGSYVYLCPKDLLFWASPVIKDGKNVGSFIAGPVISIDPEELEIYDTVKAMNIKEVSPDVAYSFSRILFMCASFMFSDFNQQLNSLESGFEFQNKIYQSIQDLKENRLTNGFRGAVQALQSSIKTGNDKVSKDRLAECVSICIDNFGVTLQDTKGWSALLINSMLQGALDGHADEVIASREAVSTIKVVNEADKVGSVFDILDAQRASFCKMISSNMMEQGLNPQMLKAIHYMQNNLANPISEYDVAKHVQLSVSHFSRLFNASSNMSFSKYLNKLRTDRAKELLLSTDMTILEICEVTGYEDQSYFTRIFKKYQGMSPNAFRMKIGKYPSQNLEIHS